jgi:DNA-binding MarR family transcriptional regulator
LIESSNLPEPDPFTPAEFDAWRGLIRLRETVMREIDRRLAEAGGISLDDYGILVTLVGRPGMRLRMSALGERRLLTPSGITRAVMRLEERGLVRREPAAEDGRGAVAVLTHKGLQALRRAQRVHHATVRELYLDRLDERDQRRLAELLEQALPGVVSSELWPPPAAH